MKLRDYLINPFQDDHDFIYIDKFENLFHYLHNDRDVIFYPNRKKPSIEKSDYLSQNHTLMTKAEILSIFEEFKSTKSTLLMLNPDVDMPMIKDYYRLITLDHLPFDQNLQSNLELLTLEDFLDSDFINRIPDNMQIFCHSVIHDNKKLHMIPLGRDPKSRHIASHKYRLEKIRLCHYSCTLPPLSLHWYGRIRQYIFDGLKHSEFISCDDTLSKQSISYYIKDITKYSDFFNTLASTKFIRYNGDPSKVALEFDVFRNQHLIELYTESCLIDLYMLSECNAFVGGMVWSEYGITGWLSQIAKKRKITPYYNVEGEFDTNGQQTKLLLL